MTDITPNFLAGDLRLAPLAELAKRLDDIDPAPLLVYLVDRVEAELLPILAEQFHVAGDEGWLLTQSEAQRRELIKQAIDLHRYKGTRWALQQVLTTLSLSGKVSEWFEYGGQPFHFKINIDLSSRGMDQATFDALLQMLGQYQNARSQLEQLALTLGNGSPTPSLAAATVGGEAATVYPWRQTALNQHSRIQLGIAHWSVETVTVYPDS